MNEKIGKWLDRCGVTAAWLCAAHCLALPLFMSLAPFVSLSFLLDETTEQMLFGLSALIAVLSLLPSYIRNHRRLHSIFLAVSGIGLINLTHLLFEEKWALKILFLITGAGLLTAAHLFNRRLCAACDTCGISGSNGERE